MPVGKHHRTILDVQALRMPLPDLRRRRADDEAVAADEPQPADRCEKRDRTVDRVEQLESERQLVTIARRERVVVGKTDRERNPRAVFRDQQTRSDVCERNAGFLDFRRHAANRVRVLISASRAA